jgi:dTDP-4-dehydrorhamnose reductase
VDLTAAGEVERLVQELQPDVVLHAAAIREPDRCEEFPEEARLLNTEVPARFVRSLPPSSQLIHISTDYVFDGRHPPYREEDAVAPVNEYGRTKVEAETHVLSHPRGTVLRIPVLVGEGPGFIEQMVAALRSGAPEEVDDVLVRHPTWTVDVAGVCAWLIQEGASGIWHASSEQGGTRYQLTKRVGEMLGLSSDHLTPSQQVLKRKAARPLNTKLSPRKLLQAGGPACRELEDTLSALGIW